ncbi:MULTISPECIES: DMT family transporter [unclassified Leisingera]|uniref:DMT family transporter n=1 Tax=unclassified Leisingera TaxID=2614906 RepID=UPI00031B01B9|nr:MULTISPECIES: DMT family transporter [unclassified Leisingera]KIC53693.1 membrane protein [Leisingera sp. ANG-S]KID07193.1 membrane protein [Leisingera sp. ANG1]
MAKSLTSHRPVLAVLLKVTAIALFTALSGIIKATSETVPAGEAVFFRSFFAIPVIVAWLAARGELRHGLITKKPMFHVWRGLVGTSAMGMTFMGLALLPLPEVTAIGYATPIFTLLLAALFLGETIRLVRISAVAIGLLGVLIMIWPRLGGDLGDGAMLGVLLVVGATVARGFVQIHIRRMVQSEHTAAIVFYFSLTASALALLTAPFGWVMPDAQTAALLVSAGLVGGVAQILVTSSYRFAPASMLAPYDYASMIFAIVIGYVWFDEWPTLVMLAGAALVIAGNVLVIWREHRLGLRRGKAKPLIDPKGG